LSAEETTPTDNLLMEIAPLRRAAIILILGDFRVSGILREKGFLTISRPPRVSVD
jgi:hypothetical protein